MSLCVNCQDPEATQSGPRGECSSCGYFWEEYPEYVPPMTGWQIKMELDELAVKLGV